MSTFEAAKRLPRLIISARPDRLCCNVKAAEERIAQASGVDIPRPDGPIASARDDKPLACLPTVQHSHAPLEAA